MDSCCPKCKEESPEWNGVKYKGNNGKMYPIFSDEKKYYNGWNDCHDWVETHYCNECNLDYSFDNGAV